MKLDRLPRKVLLAIAKGECRNCESEYLAKVESYTKLEADYCQMKSRAAEAVAELEAALPLIKASLFPEWPDRMYQNNDLTRAARSYRESQKPKEG